MGGLGVAVRHRGGLEVGNETSCFAVVFAGGRRGRGSD